MLSRAARQIALPQIGLAGQERIIAATAAVAGDGLAAEVVARALAAAGIGRLRWIRRGAVEASVAAALVGSNPDAIVEHRAWPGGGGAGAGGDAGVAWVTALDGAAVVVRVGFDDDPMLRAAVRCGVPAVVLRGRADAADVVSFRRHGPCPHAALDVPEARAEAADEDDGAGAGAVLAAEIAAAEALAIVAGFAGGADASSEAPAQVSRARHVRVPLDGGEPRVADIPWAPECFACGGHGVEMSFS